MSDRYFYSINKKIICEPFAPKSVPPKDNNGFAFMEQKVGLINTKVLYDFFLEDRCVFHAGDIIWLDGNSVKANWALTYYEFQGQKCMIVPYESVILGSE